MCVYCINIYSIFCLHCARVHLIHWFADARCLSIVFGHFFHSFRRNAASSNCILMNKHFYQLAPIDYPKRAVNQNGKRDTFTYFRPHRMCSNRCNGCIRSSPSAPYWPFVKMSNKNVKRQSVSKGTTVIAWSFQWNYCKPLLFSRFRFHVVTQ